MKILKQFFFAFLLSLLALGCAQQRATEPTAEQMEETRRQQAQAEADRDKARAAGENVNDNARTTGEKIGQKAREVEIDTRDERAELKKNAEAAAQRIKEESIRLADKTRAAASGIKDGWDGKTVDINTASRATLVNIGVTDAEAGSIIARRPYASKSDLLKRNVISQATYDRVESRVTVK